MAYSAAADRSKAIKTIFIRPGSDLKADDFIYGAIELAIYPGMCVNLHGATKYSSGDASNKGGYYEPQVTNFNYYDGSDVLTLLPLSSVIMTRQCSPGDLVALRVGAGTTSNYAKGALLVNQAHIAAADSTGLTFNSGTLVASTVCHFVVEEAPAANIASVGLVLARCVSPIILKDVA